MDVVLLVDNNTQSASCTIFDVDSDSCLADLRLRINEEVSEFMPKDYFFIYSGVPVSKAQEGKLDAKRVASIEGKNSADYIVRTMLFPAKHQLLVPLTEKKKLTINEKMMRKKRTKKKTVREETEEDGEQELSDTSTAAATNREGEEHDKKDAEEDRKVSKVTEKPPNTSFFGLRSPTSWSIRGIKVYDEKEIDNAEGKEKIRRRFWNKRAKDLAKTTKKKSDIYKQIHDEWRLEKSDILSGEKSGIPNTAGLKKGTLEKNSKRAAKMKEEWKELSRKINDLESKRKKNETEKNNLKDLKAKRSDSKSGLRKAQDTFRKNIKKARMNNE